MLWVLKRQTGVRVDVEVWSAYKSVCSREELRPNEAVEGFLRVVVDAGSALSVLRLLRGAVGVRAECFDDYARVLLNWYKGGRLWMSTGNGENAVDAMLLFALKDVADAQLRKDIQEALVEGHSKDARTDIKGEESEVKEEAVVDQDVLGEGGLTAGSKEILDIRKQVQDGELTIEQVKEILKKLIVARDKLKNQREAKAGRSGSPAKLLKKLGA